MTVSILMHICCAPCALYPVRILREEGGEVCGFFSNPNIHPYLEYKRRLDTLDVYAEREGLRLIREEGYPVEGFLRQIAFHEEDRCRYCYQMRLEKTAQAAKGGGFDAFTTTLLYSRHQKHELIRSAAEAAARRYDISFLYRDFRDGWAEGVRMSKALEMYRQPYCGCLYSEKERYCRLSPKSH